jgi:hypothetical protein
MTRTGDCGADNPHRNIPNRHETRKGGQGPTLGCSAIDDDDDDDMGLCDEMFATISLRLPIPEHFISLILQH